MQTLSPQNPRYFRLPLLAAILVSAQAAVLCLGHAPTLNDPLQRQDRLSRQARRDANLLRGTFAAALLASDFACGRKPYC